MTNKEIIKNWFSNIDKENFQEIRNAMHSDHRFYNPMTPAAIGIEEHLGMMQMMTSSFSGEHKIEVLIEENGKVAAWGTWSGKHTGEFEGVPATNNEIHFSWADFFEIVGGKVRNEKFEMNPMAIMSQIGAVAHQENL